MFGSGDPAGAFDRLDAWLHAAPVELTAPDACTVRLGYSELITWTGSWLYQPTSWEQPAFGAPFLAAAEQATADPAGPAAPFVGQLLLHCATMACSPRPTTGPEAPPRRR